MVKTGDRNRYKEGTDKSRIKNSQKVRGEVWNGGRMERCTEKDWQREGEEQTGEGRGGEERGPVVSAG